MRNVAVEPFTIEVPQHELDELRRRVLATRWPEEIPGSGSTYGANLDAVRGLAHYWAAGYDWRRHERELNGFPQFTTVIDGQKLHFLHVRSPHAEALPLVLTHGWPGSVSEFVKVIEPLVDPVGTGGDPADAFHVVVPSLPGYGFSGPTTEAGWDVRRTAQAFDELMARLGYDRYGAQGGDWGSMVTRHLGALAPKRVVGMHVNMLPAFPSGAPDDLADLTPNEARQRARGEEYMAAGQGYLAIQSSRPQTLAYALLDSPVGLLAWIAEKFWAWTDHDGRWQDAITPDELLTDVSIYWFTGTAGSAARMYYESMSSLAVLPPATREVPLGVASFPAEILLGRRRWVETDHDLRQWSEFDRGGHFAALEQPDLLVSDVRKFFRTLR
ncbi:epoxide hydrolase [Parafrankia irregularis]|uniref:Epoxide hydrolase n=1 Tax=Parafrankia irregularis TaxID=795642 RepID=A0A0S4QMK0_9ACTN|nr:MULTISPECIES: epoxide hydrolase family protein [Parafrankia]MBE3200508.1 alpha/beta fold hydrolase [Parafrankia sp. CH37]CUU56839.1 epoxide hydrolase [Parafrankia irregularis]